MNSIPEKNAFANWNVLTHSWYPLLKSTKLKPGKSLEARLGSLSILLLRSPASLKVTAVNAYCPHLGLSLHKGTIRFTQNQIELKCALHGRKFILNDRVSDSIEPLSLTLPLCRKSTLKTYAVVEKWGMIWVYSGDDVPSDFPELDESGKPDSTAPKLKYFWRLKDAFINCHPHVATLNGLDAAHFEHLHRMKHQSTPRFEINTPSRRAVLHLCGQPQNKLLSRLVGTRNSPFQSRFISMGGNISITDVQAPCRFALLLAGKPHQNRRTREWGCLTTTILALPNLAPRQIIAHVTLLAHLFKDDKRILDNFQLKPNFENSEEGLRKSYELVANLPYQNLEI